MSALWNKYFTYTPDFRVLQFTFKIGFKKSVRERLSGNICFRARNWRLEQQNKLPLSNGLVMYDYWFVNTLQMCTQETVHNKQALLFQKLGDTHNILLPR